MLTPSVVLTAQGSIEQRSNHCGPNVCTRWALASPGWPPGAPTSPCTSSAMVRMVQQSRGLRRRHIKELLRQARPGGARQGHKQPLNKSIRSRRTMPGRKPLVDTTLGGLLGGSRALAQQRRRRVAPSGPRSGPPTYSHRARRCEPRAPLLVTDSEAKPGSNSRNGEFRATSIAQDVADALLVHVRDIRSNSCCPEIPCVAQVTCLSTDLLPPLPLRLMQPQN